MPLKPQTTNYLRRQERSLLFDQIRHKLLETSKKGLRRYRSSNSATVKNTKPKSKRREGKENSLRLGINFWTMR